MFRRTAIIGAGLSGLSAAFHLGNSATVFEKKPEVGGLCGTISVDGYTLDYTGHYLHLKTQYVYNLLNSLGVKLDRHLRRSEIYLDGYRVPYPFQQNLYALPKDLIIECLWGAIQARLSGSDTNKNAIKNFEEWIKNSVGDGIAKYFMIPYNTKIWATFPAEMTTEWMGKYVPMPDLKDIVEGAFGPKENVGYNASFYYPAENGISEIANAFASKIDDIRLETEVVALNLKNRELVLNTGDKFSFDILVSTMPLPELINRIIEIPENIKRMSDQLQYTTVYGFNIGVQRIVDTQAHWIYFPNPDLCFYRVGIPSNLRKGMAPPGHSSLCAEVSVHSSKVGSFDVSRMFHRVKEDLIKVGLLNENDTITMTHIMKIDYAYVIYNEVRTPFVNEIMRYLNSHGIFSIGRYGAWEYSAMEDAILAGKNIAEIIMLDSAKTQVASASESGAIL